MKVVLLIAGCAGVGKTTLAGMVRCALESMGHDSFPEAFAHPLKEIVALKTGVSLGVLCGTQSDKNNPEKGAYGRSARQLMQEEGAEARARLGPTCWADRLCERALFHTQKFVTVDDARFPEEEIRHVAKQLAGRATVLPVRVTRSVAAVLEHQSECLIRAEPRDTFLYEIANEGTLEELEKFARLLAQVMVTAAL